ncbi:MAG TPA: glycosyltransferase 61 family protein [Xenococcaceae cyanobacterium]|jgi:hypothetical protein
MTFNNSLDATNKVLLRKRNNWIAVLSNQIQILELSKSEKIILLKPINPDGGLGSIEHYYHFIFDLLLPIYYLLQKTFPSNLFLLEDFGIFTNQLVRIFPESIQIIDKISLQQNRCSRVQLIGMNPKVVFFKNKILEDFKQNISFRLKVNLRGEANKILLIERLPPDKYFLLDAQSKGGGALRRSIINHAKLASTLASMVKNPFEFYNIQLETISLEAQIDYFDKAAVVIAQHGAGLANCVWMRRKKAVIELNHNELKLNHFRIISKLKQLDYFLYKTESTHIKIDLKKFTSWLLKQSIMKQYFQPL